MTKAYSAGNSLRSQILRRVTPWAVAIMVMASLLTVWRVQREVRQQVAAQLAGETEHIAQATRIKLQHAMEACAAVASNDIVINAIIDPEHRNSTLQSYIRSMRLPGADAMNIVMTDYRGKPIAQKHSSIASCVVARDTWLPQVMAGQSVVDIRESILTVAHPVTYGGRPEAAVVATFDAQRFLADLQPVNDGLAIAFWLDGQLVHTSSPQFIDHHQQLAKPQDWLVRSAAVETIPGLRITVLRSDEVATRATRAVQYALVSETAIILCVLVMGLWFATSMAVEPTKDLIHAIDDVRSNTNLSRRVNVDSSSAEFVHLGQQFNSMLAELQKSTVTREEYKIPALVAKYTDNAVVVTDPQGRIEWVNEGFTRITGYALNEVLNRKPGAFLQGPDTDPKTVQEMGDAIRSRRGVNTEILNYDRNGQPYWVDIEIRPIYSEQNEVVNFIAIESDISEQKRIESEKESLAREMIALSRQAGMAEVATGVLHNVGNVLNSVNISTELIAESLRTSKVDSINAIADVIEKNADQLPQFFESERGRQFVPLLRKLAEAMLRERSACQREVADLFRSIDHIKQIVATQQSHAQHGGLLELLHLPELVSEALRLKRETLESHHIVVETVFDEVPNVCADRHKVIEILVNLITNAANAMTDADTFEKRLTIQIQGFDEKLVMLQVIDNGIGIAPENLDRIFGHGFTTREEGHGFGLHSCGLAAQSMGGSLTVHSDGEGLGAIFTLQLPITDFASTPPAASVC